MELLRTVKDFFTSACALAAPRAVRLLLRRSLLLRPLHPAYRSLPDDAGENKVRARSAKPPLRLPQCVSLGAGAAAARGITLALARRASVI